MHTIGSHSIGISDRFAHQAAAQLPICKLAAGRSTPAILVWNESNREHSIIGGVPGSVLDTAKQAVDGVGRRKFKVVPKMGARYLDALGANREIIAPNATANLLDRHIIPMFV